MPEIETYWRAGYHVQGSKPVEVVQHERLEKAARAIALEAGESIAKQLDDLGLPNTVTLWTKRWTVQNVVKSGPLDEFQILREHKPQGSDT